MNRLVLRVPLVAAAALLALAFGCKSGEEQPANPRPPAEAPPPAEPPKMEMAEEQPAEEGEAAAEPEAGGGAAAAQVSPEAQAEADQLWTSLCATCHGPTGKGDGPVSAGFPVKPRSFADQQWQQETTDENIAKVIVEGGASIGKSPLMPGNPQLSGKPEVVQALVKKVRDLGKQ